MSLDAVRDAALAHASVEAEQIGREAQERAAQIIATARAQADALVTGRRDIAQARADTHARRRLARARSEARAAALRAQRRVLSEAIGAARAQARSLTDDPRYARMLTRVTAEARERLAGSGVVSIAPAPSGGVIARAGSREIDYSLDAQIDRSLETLSGELEGLWR